jgi:hypothetical protein
MNPLRLPTVSGRTKTTAVGTAATTGERQRRVKLREALRRAGPQAARHAALGDAGAAIVNPVRRHPAAARRREVHLRHVCGHEVEHLAFQLMQFGKGLARGGCEQLLDDVGQRRLGRS